MKSHPATIDSNYPSYQWVALLHTVIPILSFVALAKSNQFFIYLCTKLAVLYNC